MNQFDQNLIDRFLNNIPDGWLKMTTHRLDIYNEKKAKTEFTDALEKVLEKPDITEDDLEKLPTAYDYVRLGHQLSSALELFVSRLIDVSYSQVISFSSKVMPVLAVLRSDALNSRRSHVYLIGESDLGDLFKESILKDVYGYSCKIYKVQSLSEVGKHKDGTVVSVLSSSLEKNLDVSEATDVSVNLLGSNGSVLVIHESENNLKNGITELVSSVQHVRRRESIALTPTDCYNELSKMIGHEPGLISYDSDYEKTITNFVQLNSGSIDSPVVASSGLSVQYAIFMGYVEKIKTEFKGKKIKFVIPPNCYGGTNDQARRIAALDPDIDILDMRVDGGQNLNDSLDAALDELAKQDSLGIVLAEIPTNPRVEVPDLMELGNVLRKDRFLADGNLAPKPVFTVDQTFCPNVPLLGEDSLLAGTEIVSYVSASKFPSGGECTGGYAAGNILARPLMEYVAKHLRLNDNTATNEQFMLIAKNIPTMASRVEKAYENTKKFVTHIKTVLPEAKLNFVSDDVAALGFTPSVFSLELPVSGATAEDREEKRRELNLKLISYMIDKNPKSCKHCVSYGQLKGSYWTIPATSTQGTTKESDKDYIIRVALAPDVDVESLNKSFSEFFEMNEL